MSKKSTNNIFILIGIIAVIVIGFFVYNFMKIQKLEDNNKQLKDVVLKYKNDNQNLMALNTKKNNELIHIKNSINSRNSVNLAGPEIVVNSVSLEQKKKLENELKNIQSERNHYKTILLNQQKYKPQYRNNRNYSNHNYNSIQSRLDARIRANKQKQMNNMMNKMNKILEKKEELND